MTYGNFLHLSIFLIGHEASAVLESLHKSALILSGIGREHDTFSALQAHFPVANVPAAVVIVVDAVPVEHVHFPELASNQSPM